MAVEPASSAMSRIGILKTYKLFIGGTFPRSESGRSIEVRNLGGDVFAHACRASRKDLREAVEAASKVQGGWASATAYLRGQILYRMAEMLEGKRAEFGNAAHDLYTGAWERKTKSIALREQGEQWDAEYRSTLELDAAIDRLVHYAGWTDKFQQVLGCANPVAGPYYNFTIPEATGVVGVIAPDDWPLLGLVSLIAPPLCAGCTVVVLASEPNPIPGAIFGEVCATSDVPPGVINVLTGLREELIPHFASHRGINAIHAANVSAAHATVLREGAAENLKRVVVRELPSGAGRRAGGWFDDETCESPWWIEPFVEMKTVWHPSSS
jgi:acyl-CoA reductase-like NAD-dependent aldehyde dehydrogenase